MVGVVYQLRAEERMYAAQRRHLLTAPSRNPAAGCKYWPIVERVLDEVLPPASDKQAFPSTDVGETPSRG